MPRYAVLLLVLTGATVAVGVSVAPRLRPGDLSPAPASASLAPAPSSNAAPLAAPAAPGSRELTLAAACLGDPRAARWTHGREALRLAELQSPVCITADPDSTRCPPRFGGHPVLRVQLPRPPHDGLRAYVFGVALQDAQGALAPDFEAVTLYDVPAAAGAPAFVPVDAYSGVLYGLLFAAGQADALRKVHAGLLPALPPGGLARPEALSPWPSVAAPPGCGPSPSRH